MLEVSDSTRGAQFVAYDGNGNVAGLFKATDGTSAATYEYGPFGELLRKTGAMANANPFRFSTKYQEDEPDLLYYGYRYYNAGAGRWLNRDPLAPAPNPITRTRSAPTSLGDLNWYCFTRDDAINRSDWLGLCTKGCTQNGRCVVEVTPYGDNPDGLAAVPQLVDLYGHTETFGLLYSGTMAGAGASQGAEECIAQTTSGAIEHFTSTGQEALRRAAKSLQSSYGNEVGWAIWTRIEYEECQSCYICITHWLKLPKSDSWSQYLGSEDLGGGRSSDAAQALEIGEGQCKTSLREWSKDHKPCN